eukprot:CAMPEP_0184475682 /NCGR_PEP_ID=MMETSP0740-20130409/146692_1 /TAXON_ID=385413 /ORGANISM="Thalassiosira miniscula, Strain CCMP1093" /LENGTH=430 /DNA_ID=CAMNT_0026853215 /DNA_START=330 /DNA_END=1622 /DNA_ORIENTATION=-
MSANQPNQQANLHPPQDQNVGPNSPSSPAADANGEAMDTDNNFAPADDSHPDATSNDKDAEAEHDHDGGDEAKPAARPPAVIANEEASPSIAAGTLQELQPSNLRDDSPNENEQRGPSVEEIIDNDKPDTMISSASASVGGGTTQSGLLSSLASKATRSSPSSSSPKSSANQSSLQPSNLRDDSPNENEQRGPSVEEIIDNDEPDIMILSSSSPKSSANQSSATTKKDIQTQQQQRGKQKRQCFFAKTGRGKLEQIPDNVDECPVPPNALSMTTEAEDASSERTGQEDDRGEQRQRTMLSGGGVEQIPCNSNDGEDNPDRQLSAASAVPDLEELEEQKKKLPPPLCPTPPSVQRGMPSEDDVNIRRKLAMEKVHPNDGEERSNTVDDDDDDEEMQSRAVDSQGDLLSIPHTEECWFGWFVDIVFGSFYSS